MDNDVWLVWIMDNGMDMMYGWLPLCGSEMEYRGKSHPLLPPSAASPRLYADWIKVDIGDW